MANVQAIALSFCRYVADHPEVNNSDARIGAWLIGAVAKTGQSPLELTYRDIYKGFSMAGSSVEGLGSRYETIRASIEKLENIGLISCTEGRQVGFGYTSKHYTIHEV